MQNHLQHGGEASRGSASPIRRLFDPKTHRILLVSVGKRFRLENLSRCHPVGGCNIPHRTLSEIPSEITEDLSFSHFAATKNIIFYGRAAKSTESTSSPGRT